jgi:hypothetical protein
VRKGDAGGASARGRISLSRSTIAERVAGDEIVCTLSLNIESGFETRREGGSCAFAFAFERASMERVEKGERRENAPVARWCRSRVPTTSRYGPNSLFFSLDAVSQSLSLTLILKKKNPERERGEDAPETR